jgi:hypothetical protein
MKTVARHGASSGSRRSARRNSRSAWRSSWSTNAGRAVARRRLRPRAHDLVGGGERALHQLARGVERRGARVEPAEEALDEAARDLRRDHALGRRVERADVERARVPQRHRGRARRERLVHVDEVERRAAEHVVDGARYVERRSGRRAAPRRGERQQLPDAEHAHAAVGIEEVAGADQPPRLAHQLRRPRGREHDHPVPAPRQLIRQRPHERADLVLVLPRVRRDLRDGEALAHERGSLCASVSAASS